MDRGLADAMEHHQKLKLIPTQKRHPNRLDKKFNKGDPPFCRNSYFLCGSLCNLIIKWMTAIDWLTQENSIQAEAQILLIWQIKDCSNSDKIQNLVESPYAAAVY